MGRERAEARALMPAHWVVIMAKKPVIEGGESPPALIKMTRDTQQYPDSPTEAEVHPDEVESWKSHDWKVAE